MPHVVLRAALLGLSLLTLAAGPASAHASLVGSDPADGSTVTAAPATIELSFNEDIGNPAYFTVTAPDGTNLAVTEVAAVDAKVTAALAGADQRGRYSVAYRVVSTDGHPVEGTIHFSTSNGRSVKQAATPDEQSFVHRHSAHLLWGILAAGGAITLLLVPLRRRDDKSHA